MHHINWRDVVHEITSKGLSQYDIARFAGVDQSTICRIADGRAPEPRYGVAVKLLELRKTKQAPATPLESTQAALPLDGRGAAHAS